MNDKQRTFSKAGSRGKVLTLKPVLTLERVRRVVHRFLTDLADH